MNAGIAIAIASAVIISAIGTGGGLVLYAEDRYANKELVAASQQQTYEALVDMRIRALRSDMGYISDLEANGKAKQSDINRRQRMQRELEQLEKTKMEMERQRMGGGG